jgi:hypothetical protein
MGRGMGEKPNHTRARSQALYNTYTISPEGINKPLVIRT